MAHVTLVCCAPVPSCRTGVNGAATAFMGSLAFGGGFVLGGIGVMAHSIPLIYLGYGFFGASISVVMCCHCVVITILLSCVNSGLGYRPVLRPARCHAAALVPGPSGVCHWINCHGLWGRRPRHLSNHGRGLALALGESCCRLLARSAAVGMTPGMVAAQADERVLKSTGIRWACRPGQPSWQGGDLSLC